MSMIITYTGFEVAVLYPDGSVFIQDTISGVPNPTIGEKKRVIYTFTTSYDMRNVNLWMKFALFNQGVIGVGSSVAKTPMDYAITFPDTLTPGDYPVANPGDLSYYAADATVKYSFNGLLKSKVNDPSAHIGGGLYRSCRCTRGLCGSRRWWR